MVNLDEFKYAGTNLTAFRLLDPDREEVKHVVDDWIFGEMRYGRKLDAPDQTIKVGKIHSSYSFRCLHSKTYSENVPVWLDTFSKKARLFPPLLNAKSLSSVVKLKKSFQY